MESFHTRLVEIVWYGLNAFCASSHEKIQWRKKTNIKGQILIACWWEHKNMETLGLVIWCSTITYLNHKGLAQDRIGQLLSYPCC